ncbi:MAG TPA: phosphotransferase family protein [Planctomycetaceae bacterium]|nr:phosphotransferase family protein [Planctomycetaceae bacterium]
MLDQPREVRQGEGFDVLAVDQWLKQEVPSLLGTPQVKQFPGGASNLTFLLSYENRELILRKPPAGHKAKSAHDMAREYRVQSALRPVYPAVPTMVALCQDTAIMDCDFYVMDRIRGIIPRSNLPGDLTLTRDQTRTLCQGVIDKLIELHQVDARAAGLESLGKGTGYVKRQIEGWSDRYDKSKTWNVPSWRRVRRWLRDHLPDDVATVIIHNDFRFDNVVLDAKDPLKIIGVLDWEMATLGDPLMDLGNTLAYWVQADDDRFHQMLRRQPTHLPFMLTRREVVDYYCQRMQLRTDNWTFYEVYGMFRLAVIVQQIYYRYHHRQTRNPAFRNFWLFNQYLHWRSGRAIRRA